MFICSLDYMFYFIYIYHVLSSIDSMPCDTIANISVHFKCIFGNCAVHVKMKLNNARLSLEKKINFRQSSE